MSNLIPSPKIIHLGPKGPKMTQIGLISKVRIKGTIENISYSSTWIELKTVFKPCMSVHLFICVSKWKMSYYLWRLKYNFQSTLKNRPPVSNTDPWTTHTGSLCICVSRACWNMNLNSNRNIKIAHVKIKDGYKKQ